MYLPQFFARLMVVAFAIAIIAALFWANSIGYLRDGIYWLLLTAQQIGAFIIYKRLKSEEAYGLAESKENIKYQRKINNLESDLRKAKWHYKYFKNYLDREGITLDNARQWKKYLKKKFPYG